MAPHSSTLAWKIPWMEEPRRLQSMGSQRVGHDWVTSLSFFLFSHLNYVIGLLKCLLWLPVLCLQNPLQCTFSIKDLLQLQCLTCLYILPFPFPLLRSPIWLFKFNLALRSRFHLLGQGLNLVIFLISYCHYHSLAVIIVYILYFFVLSYADVQSNLIIIYENILYSFLI